MYCNNCGAELREGVAFCEQCGTPLSSGNKHEENLKPKRNKKPLIITIITLVILLTIGVLTVAQTGILNPVQHNLNLGYKYLEEGRYEEAVIAFEKVLKIDKNNTKAVIGAADAYVGLGKFDKAIELLTLHIKTDNTKTELYDKLIKLYLDKEEYSAAQKVIDKASDNGYSYNTDNLSKGVRNKLQQANGTLSGFKAGFNVVETESKVVVVDGEGVKVRNVDSDTEKVITQSKFETSFVTDGNIAYLYDSQDQAIKMLNLNSGEITSISQIYVPIDSENDNGGGILNICEGFLYFQVYGAMDSNVDYILDIKAQKYSEMKTSVFQIGTLETYKNKIYYEEARQDMSVVTIYEANADGSNEKVLIKNAINFNIIGNILYYSQVDGEYYDENTVVKIKSYNLDTKETKSITEVKGGGWTHFTSFGFAYGSTAEDGSYGIHINRFNGSTINNKGYIVASGENYILCIEEAAGNSPQAFHNYYVVTDDGISKKFSLSSQRSVDGYADRKVYYYDISSGAAKMKTLNVEFE